MNIRVEIERPGASWPAVGVRPSVDAQRIMDQLLGMVEYAGASYHMALRIGVLGGKAIKPTAVSLHDDCGQDVDEALTRRIVSHMGSSMMPLLASGGKDLPPSAVCCVKRVERLPIGDEAGSEKAIVFPVKLGGGSEGAVILAGDRLSLDVTRILELHRRAYDVFKALLAIELEKSAPRQNLNDRELECLQLAGEGLKSELIGQRLNLSVHTVNAYLSTATAKLDSVNRIQAIAKAIRLGYLA